MKKFHGYVLVALSFVMALPIFGRSRKNIFQKASNA